MTCHRCDKPPRHSILIRKGEAPFNPEDPKTPDLSKAQVLGFCTEHWVELQKFLGHGGPGEFD